MGQTSTPAAEGSDLKSLYMAAGVAALLAGLVFRRNLSVEISLFSAIKQPETAAGWFALLQEHRLLGLAYLHIFDVVNYALVGLLFLALFFVLRRSARSEMTIASLCAFLGITAYFASNTALSMLALSDQYAAAVTESQKVGLQASGEALLVLGRFSSPGAHPGGGGYLSLLFLAAATLITSLVMLRSGLFHRVVAYTGILASALDLAYCLGYAFLQAINSELLAVTFIPAGGLLIMLWHILTGLRLIRLGRRERRPVPQPV